MNRLLVLILILASGPAIGQVTVAPFSFEPNTTDFELDDRLIYSTAKTEFIINAKDCELYKRDGRALNVQFDITGVITGGTWSIEFGDSCDLDSAAADNCVLFQEGSRALSIGTLRYEYDIPFSSLIDIDCDSGSDKQRQMLIVISDNSHTGNETDKPSTRVQIRLDFQAPATPADLTVTGGNKNLSASWKADDNATEYKVFWSSRSFTSSEALSGAPDISSNTVTASSFQITSGIENNKTYFVGVAAVDENDNVSALGSVVSATAVATQSFYEVYLENGGDSASPGGFCFVATTAHGGYDQAPVRALRRFRDNVLAKSTLGRQFTSGYYRFGPTWAESIRGNSTKRYLARMLLFPLVGTSSLATSSPMLFVLVLLSLLGCALVVYRRRRCNPTR